MRATPTGWDNFEVGDFVCYNGETYRFPGEVVAVTTDGQVVVKAVGDSEGNYSGMKHIFGPHQLVPWSMGDGKSPFLVIDPERDIMPQFRKFCHDHPFQSVGETLGSFQLHMLVKHLDDTIALSQADTVFVNEGNNGAGEFIRNDRPKAEPILGNLHERGPFEDGQ